MGRRTSGAAISGTAERWHKTKIAWLGKQSFIGHRQSFM
jgi:hypothetical protein